METDDPNQVLADPKLRAAVAKPRWTPAQAKQILEAQRKSGLSVRDFAQALGCKSWRLYKWRQRAPSDKDLPAPPRRPKPAPAVDLLPLRIAPPEKIPTHREAPHIELRHPSGLRIRFSHPPPDSFFQHLLQILVPLC